MGVSDDLRELGVPPGDGRAVGLAILRLVLSPAGRLELIRRWEEETGGVVPEDVKSLISLGG